VHIHLALQGLDFPDELAIPVTLCFSAVVFYFGAIFVIGLALARESTEHTRLELMHMADKHNSRNAHSSVNDSATGKSNSSAKCLHAFSSTACSEEHKRAAAGEVMLQDMLRKGVFDNSTGVRDAGTFNETMYEIFKSLNKVSNSQRLLGLSCTNVL
jgi:hypothetical protein